MVKMKPALAAFAFAARHFFIVIFAMVVGFICWTITYMVLLLIAVITDSGIGGPLAYPAGIFMIFAAGVLVAWGIFTPSCAIGAIFCRLLKLPRLAAIPVVFVTAGLLTYLGYGLYIQLITTHSMPPVGTVFFIYVCYLSIPLGAYWWLTEGPGVLFDTFRYWIGKKRRKATTVLKIGHHQDSCASSPRDA